MSAGVWAPGWRQQQIDSLRAEGQGQPWDLIVIGGGITGAGVFREATRRGLKVLLIERRDFAWGTSSRSSKMVHGGLRYLASGKFGLTRDAVRERQRLLEEAPGLVEPLQFLMGHYRGGFPGPFVFNLLLNLYDLMAGKRNHRFIRSGVGDFLAPGMEQNKLRGATQFADAVTDDARLVLRVLHEANHEGGVALNYVAAEDILRAAGRVTGVRLKDELSGDCFDVHARVVINATGAWTDELRARLGADAVIRPLRGSHLLLPSWRLPAAYSISFLHPKDKRPVFVFPWEGATVIGTTDLDHQQDMQADARITQQEVDYLLEAVNAQFPGAHIQESDVISSWSGVRPVVAKASAKPGAGGSTAEGAVKPSDEKREHSIWDDDGLISVAGGKLTTFRLIALDVLARAGDYLPALAASNPELEDAPTFRPPRCGVATAAGNPLSSGQLRRLRGRYGEAADAILQQLSSDARFADSLANTETLYAELCWILENEAVVHLEDLLLRRTRLGLLLANGAASLLPTVQPLCQHILGWSDERWHTELAAYTQLVEQYYSLPKRRAGSPAPA